MTYPIIIMCMHGQGHCIAVVLIALSSSAGDRMQYVTTAVMAHRDSFKEEVSTARRQPQVAAQGPLVCWKE